VKNKQSAVRDAVAEWAKTYKPQMIAAADWEQAGLKAFVIEQLERLDPPGVAQAKKDALELAKIAKWCLDQGLDLDVEVVLDPDTVERYTTYALADDAHKGDYRARLRRLGRTLTVKAPWEPAAAPLKRRTIALPYEADDLGRLLRDAQRQPTQLRHRAFRAVLALGLGAGLDGRWAGHVRGLDVTVRRGVTLVEVGAPAPRKVPVLATWEDEVQQLAASAGQGLLLGGQPPAARNLVNRRVAEFVLGQGSPRLVAARLRSTWLVGHLARGIRLPELASAAGLQGITTLSDLLPHVPPVTEVDAEQQLRAG
jgi:hypothetical protein